MNQQQVVRKIARMMPADLKQLRGKLMFEALCESLGVEEVTCPACSGTGWIDLRSLERCPICCGFLEVPDRLAEWFKAGLRRSRKEKASARPAYELIRKRERPALDGERQGRTGDVTYSVCLPLALVES